MVETVRDSAVSRTVREARDSLGVMAAGSVCALGYLLTSPVGDVGVLHGLYAGRHLLVVAIRWTVVLLGIALVYAVSRRSPIRLWALLLVAVACQLPGLLTPPQSSSDAYRYVLDGRVQLHGLSPYRYAPLDDHLADLRDPLLFPGLTRQQQSGVATPPRIPSDPVQVARLTQPDPRTRINRPGVPTIYPPVAEAWFAAIAAVTPWSAGTLGLQIASALLALAVMLALGLVLQRRQGTPLAAVWWGWVPTVVLETGNNAHVDILAAALVVAAVLVVGNPRRQRQVLAGVLIGLAIATKILPMLILPAITVIRRERPLAGILRVPVPALVTVLLSYVPHLLAAGSLVLGYLPGYLTEEGFSDGKKKFAVLALFLPTPVRAPLALVLMVGLALWVLRQVPRRRPEHLALWMYGGALLIATPEYPWYGLPLLALASVARRPEWLALVAAMQFSYVELHSPGVPVGYGYLVAGLIILGCAYRRRHGNVIVAENTGLPVLTKL